MNFLKIKQKAEDKKSSDCNVKVIGAGPTGALLSLALSNVGSTVTLFDASERDVLLSRNRAYALTHSSRRILQEVGIWESIKPILHPFSSLQIEDRGIFRKANFGLDDLSPSNKRYGAIGWIVDHKQLMQVIFKKITEDPNIKTQFGLSSNSYLENYQFAIAADGPKSLCRRSLGIPQLRFPYVQNCIVFKVFIRGASQSRAHEILREEGPLALLPMGGELFQVIWSAPAAICKERTEMSPANFLDKLASVLPLGFEPDILLDRPVSFPVQFSLALGFGFGNRLLIGESLHCFHPVGGQGLNVCWRDVHTLMNLIDSHNKGRISSNHLFRLYGYYRFLDVLSVALLTDLLVRFYSNRIYIVKVFRFFVISGISRIALFRRFLLHFMTDGITKRIKSL